ncbi:hypothetical protein NQ317_018428 [Molorchus minor]|uniref:Uncharacterized protein n=1 Tax=Molorchus minor TaxID=1323400 RepID=A0ABQ9JQT0_9CUCU|nr:hypothetical protein NQ317_018428 [Molorchus minor]
MAKERLFLAIPFIKELNLNVFKSLIIARAPYKLKIHAAPACNNTPTQHNRDMGCQTNIPGYPVPKIAEKMDVPFRISRDILKGTSPETSHFSMSWDILVRMPFWLSFSGYPSDLIWKQSWDNIGLKNGHPPVIVAIKFVVIIERIKLMSRSRSVNQVYTKIFKMPKEAKRGGFIENLTA